MSKTQGRYTHPRSTTSAIIEKARFWSLRDRCLLSWPILAGGHNLALVLLVLGFCSVTSTVTAQPTQPTQETKPASDNKPARTTKPDAFSPNPLELKVSDPLLPATNRPLTVAEQEQLMVALDELDAQATAQLVAGNSEAAFDTWNRELRLRRSLGLVPEVQALSRVGAIAWNNNLTPQVRWITARLDAILKQTQPTVAQKPTDNKRNVVASSLPPADRIAVLEALGVAYQQVRQSQAAAATYREILADARQQQNAAKIEATLLTLGQLYANWFDYANATSVYRELLQTAQAKSDVPNEIVYLNQLVFIQERAKQPAQAIPYQEQLLDLYQQQNLPQAIPALRIKIADNYQRVSQLDKAELNYQLAYQLAQPLLQLAYTSEALQKLGQLYRKNDRPDAALRIYNYLIGVEQQSYSAYGAMEAYDQIGQIYLSRKEYPQALGAFQQGLALAKQLKYRVDYFTNQVQKSQESPSE